MEKQIRYFALTQLAVSGLNVRKHDAERELETLAASIEAQGVLMPLIVRPLGSGDGEQFEILAGQRRYLACQRLAQNGVAEPLPCIVIEPGDDAKALEISLAENSTQLPMDPMEQFEAFAALVKLHVGIAEIAARYGVSERIVRQRLALAKLIPDLKHEIRNNKIAAQDIQSLTMATVPQQREWLKLYKKQSWNAPTGPQLKAWICGGANVETSVALFPLENYTGPLLADLFGDKTYFGDSEAFWTLQNAAIEEKRQEFEKAGWTKVVVWQRNQHFPSWEHETLTKKQGGWVFIVPKTNGEVEILKGLIPRQLLKKAQAAAQKAGGKAEPMEKYIAEATTEEPAARRRGELTAPMADYLKLHKQAAASYHLSLLPGLALRVAVAAMVGGVATWNVRRDDRVLAGEATALSVREGASRRGYDGLRRDAARLLGFEDGPDEEPYLVGRHGSERELAETLARLIDLSDEDVFGLLAVLTAETLPAGSGLVEALGRHMNVDMRQCWRLDSAFLGLLTDKEALTEIVKELDMPAGKNPKCADLRATVQRWVNGEGCQPAEGWVPRYLEFPPRGYTGRFNAPTAQDYESMAGALGLPVAGAASGAGEPPAPDEAFDGPGEADGTAETFGEFDRAA